MLSKNKWVKNLVLRPTSALWEGAYRVRRSLYEYGVFKKNYFKIPIISVGNVTFGGTGKTPMIIWLTRYFEKSGLTPLILTRGYKGELEHKSGILKSGERFRSNPQEYGDEPLLISRKMKKGAVVVGKRRSENLAKYFHEVNPDVVLLDDGFQHLKLYRSLNLVLFDALLPLDQYQTAPMGYLREGLTALKDADALIISRVDQVKEEKIESLISLLAPHHRPGIPIAKVRYIPEGIFDCYDNFVMNVENLAGKNILAISAIASPQSFYQLLESYGARIVDKAEFNDHYFFKIEDINNLLLRASRHNAIIMASEKDIVKIRRVSQDPRLNYLSIKVDFISGEQEVLSSIKKVLGVDS